MKFYYQSADADDDLASDITAHIAHKFKYRIMWELRHLEQRIIADKGNLQLTKDFRVEYFGSDYELAEEIGDAVKEIDFEKW